MSYLQINYASYHRSRAVAPTTQVCHVVCEGLLELWLWKMQNYVGNDRIQDHSWLTML